MKMVRNSFRNSLLLYRVDESNVKLCETRFHRNKIERLLSISRKSEVLIRNSSLTGNEIFKNTFSISKSLIKVNKTNSHGNKIKRFMLAESQSQIYIDNVTFINNHASFDFLNISRESKLEIYNAEILQNSSPKLLVLSSLDSILQNSPLLENFFADAAYVINRSSTI